MLVPFGASSNALLELTEAPSAIPLADDRDAACEKARLTEGGNTSGASVELPDLVWAALRLGDVAAVVWTTVVPEVAKLSYSTGAGDWTQVNESKPTTQHHFLLPGLPIGGQLCFIASSMSASSTMHAVLLRNSRTSEDPGPGTVYTANLMVQSTELALRERIPDIIDRFAERLWDATDGHVRAGRIVVLWGNVDHSYVEDDVCNLRTAGVTNPKPAVCNWYDVVFALDSEPTLNRAGYTKRNGIITGSTIFMDIEDAELPNTDDPGIVLLHEFGHYAFNMDDMYSPGPDGTIPCSVAGARISVMGSDRHATEFDDLAARCPNKPTAKPSWSYLVDTHPGIEERANGPVFGPVGDGGAYSLHFLPVPPLPVVRLGQDDAGWGIDAGDTPEGALPIRLDWQYSGAITERDLDWFLVRGDPATPLVVDALYPGCLGVFDLRGRSIATCAFGAPHYRATAIFPEDGLALLRAGSVVVGLSRLEYRFIAASGTPQGSMADVRCAPVRLDAEVAGLHSARLSWRDEPGSTAYNIYRADAAGALQLVASTSNTHLIDVGVTPGGIYRYEARAVVGALELPACGQVPLEVPAWPECAPAQVKVQASAEAVALAWEGVAWASSYVVWRSTAGGEREMRAAGVTSTSWQDSAEPRMSYLYAVAAIIDGETTASCGDVPITTPSDCDPWLSVERNLGTTGLSWSSSEAATGYAVYRMKANHPWSWLATVSSPQSSYVDDPSDQRVYQYQVRPIIDNVERDACNVA